MRSLDSSVTDDKRIALYLIYYLSDFLNVVFVFSDIVTVVVTVLWLVCTVYDCK